MKWILVLFTIFGPTTISTTWASTNACMRYYDLTEIHDLSRVFDDQFGAHDIQHSGRVPSVSYQHTENDHIVLLRNPHLGWNSSIKVLPGGATPQGDPRAIIYLLRPELAKKFGFRVFVRGNGKVELWVPNARRLQKVLIHINKKLKLMPPSPATEAIIFKPSSAGFLTDREIIELGSRSEGDFKILFPFADTHPELVVHEISYHLGAMLYPGILMNRAQAINESTLGLIRELENNWQVQGVSDVINEITVNRAKELDFGSANPQNYIWYYIKNLKNLNFENFPEDSKTSIIKYFEYLAHTAFTPSEVTALRLLQTLSLTETPTYKKILGDRAPPTLVEKVHIAPSPALKEIVLSQIIPGLLRLPTEAQFIPNKSAEEILTQMLTNYTARLNAFSSALDMPLD